MTESVKKTLKIEPSREQKTHSEERLRVEDSRQSRSTTRDYEVVKLSDGREFIRTPRTSIKRRGRFDLPKKPGYLRRWVSTSPNAPHSIQELVDLGYQQATDENGMQIAPIRGGFKNGEEFKLIPMEISEEMHAQIERDNKTRVESRKQDSLEKMSNADLGFGSSTYVGKDLQKFVTKQN